ncbi:MAG: universal stress protein [Methanotrichaceae archaeon]
MYKQIFVALDGSEHSDLARDAALSIAEKGSDIHLIGCHAYAASLHRTRFGDMEPGLPEGYIGEGLINLRRTHEGLIGEGLRMISDSYLEPLVKGAADKGIAYECATPEGRNYIQILRAAEERKANLLIMGAQGQGRAEGLGSTAERALLYSQGMDVLLIRKPWSFIGKSILVGIDGSIDSYYAMMRAVELAQVFDAQIEAVSVYDPFFHSSVFRSISASLPEKAKERFDLSAQEKIHDEVIDEGLKRLYTDGLEKGIRLADALGIRARSEVLAGKVCAQIQDFVSRRNISLIVLGRWGLHREQESMIGSNALRLARSSIANILVVFLEDNSDALCRLSEQISMAGSDMNSDRSVSDNETDGDCPPEAEIVVLRKMKRFAPDFHRHMLSGKMRGTIVKADDKILIYKIDETVPAGPVRVTERTRLEVR